MTQPFNYGPTADDRAEDAYQNALAEQAYLDYLELQLANSDNPDTGGLPTDDNPPPQPDIHFTDYTPIDDLAAAYLLGNLLARIHSDGGHHMTEVGLAQAVKDADTQIVKWLSTQVEVDGLKGEVDRAIHPGTVYAGLRDVLRRQWPALWKSIEWVVATSDKPSADKSSGAD